MDNVKCFNIKSGINLYYIPAEKFKTVSVNMYFHRRLRKEEASKNALLTDVLSRGCKKYPDDISVSNKLQDLYGAYFGADVLRKGEDQMLSFSVRCLADRYINGNVNDALCFLFDMVFDPFTENGAFKEEYVNQEKVNLINDIRAVINDKRSYAVLRLIQNMCEGEAYAVHELGTEEDVNKINAKILYEHYKKVLTDSPIDIFVTGEVDIQNVLSYIEKKLVNISPKNVLRPSCTPYRPKNEIINVTEKFDVTQAKLCIGFNTGISHSDKRYPALMVYNGILGGGAHSKLFNNVREKLSLAYYASSSLERYKGIMVISSGIEISNKKKATDEIFAQCDAMKKGDISEYEFTATKLAIVNSLKSFGDEISYLNDYYLGQVVGNTMMSLSAFAEKIEEVTMEDVINVAQLVKPEMIYFLTGKGGEN